MAARRTFARGLCLAAGVALAGCSSGGGSDGSGDGDSGSGGDGSDGGDAESRDDGSGSEWTETSTVEMTDELAYEPKNPGRGGLAGPTSAGRWNSCSRCR